MELFLILALLLLNLFLLIVIFRFNRKQKILEVLLTTVINFLETTPSYIKEVQTGIWDEELKQGKGHQIIQSALAGILIRTMDSHLDFGYFKEVSFSKKAAKVFGNNPVIKGIFERSFKELRQIDIDREREQDGASSQKTNL